MNHTDKLFIAEYLKNGGNGTKAYLDVKPNAKERSASVCAYKILKKPDVKEAIDKIINEKQYKSAHTKANLTKSALRIADKAESKEEFNPALKGLELVAKMYGHLSDKSEDSNQFDKLIQMFQVNIQVKNEEAIDITPEKEGKED